MFLKNPLLQVAHVFAVVLPGQLTLVVVLQLGMGVQSASWHVRWGEGGAAIGNISQ